MKGCRDIAEERSNGEQMEVDRNRLGKGEVRGRDNEARVHQAADEADAD